METFKTQLCESFYFAYFFFFTVYDVALIYSPWTGSDQNLVINNISGQLEYREATVEKENLDKLSELLRVLEDKWRDPLSLTEKPYYTLAHGDLRLSNILLREVLLLHHEMKVTFNI